MDEKFVQGLVGGVLTRHIDKTLDRNRIATLSVEIAAKLESFSSGMKLLKHMKKQNDIDEQNRNYNFLMSEMSEGEREHLEAWSNYKTNNPNQMEIEFND